MSSLLRNVRFYILAIALISMYVIYFWVTTHYETRDLQIIRLQQIYAFAAVILLYITLLIGPVCYMFSFIPFREKIVFSRRAIGVSAFMFGLLHGYVSFFGQLGGFKGLSYLGNTYLISITLSFTALVILTVLACTAFDAVITKISYPRWKFIQRFIYLAAFLVIIHALLLGTHFKDLNTFIPQLFFIALVFLLTLESIRLDAYFQNKGLKIPKYTARIVLALLVVGLIIYLKLVPQNVKQSIQMHSHGMENMNMH